MPELIAELLPRLRNGMSRDKLVNAMARAGYNVTPGAIKAIESEPGRVPRADIIEGIATVLGVAPDAFYEWPIAQARRGATAVAAAQQDGVVPSFDPAEGSSDREHAAQGQQPTEPSTDHTDRRVQDRRHGPA